MNTVNHKVDILVKRLPLWINRKRKIIIILNMKPFHITILLAKILETICDKYQQFTNISALSVIQRNQVERLGYGNPRPNQ